MGRILFLMLSAALDKIVMEDARVANWGYPQVEEDRPSKLKFIDCRGLFVKAKPVRVRQLKRDVEVMLHSFPGAPMALVNEAMVWFRDVTREGMPDVERILEVQMGLLVKEPVWHSLGVKGLAQELKADEQEMYGQRLYKAF